MVACCFAAFAALVVVPTIVDECFPAEDGAEEEDMDKCCTCTRAVVDDCSSYSPMRQYGLTTNATGGIVRDRTARLDRVARN